MSVLYTREEEGVWLDHYDHQEVPGLMELHMGELEVGQISSLLIGPAPTLLHSHWSRDKSAKIVS